MMADKIDDGGFAFPFAPPLGDDGLSATGYPYPELGMTLRDYFAGQALAGAMTTAKNIGPEIPSAQLLPIGVICYAVADAMIAARKATTP